MSEMIYGIHAVQALLERAPERFQEVFILKGREDKRLMPLIHALEAQGVVIQVASRQFLDEKSEGAVHQGIIARVKPFCAAECHGEKSGLRRGGKRPADPRHQPGAYHASAAGRERLDRRYRR